MKNSIVWSMKKLLAGLCPADAKQVTATVLQEYDAGTATLEGLEQISLKADPCKTLYRQVQAAFLLNDSSLSKWTVANKVPRVEVRDCLVKPCKSTKAFELRNRIVLASGANKVFPLNDSSAKPLEAIKCANTFPKSKGRIKNDKEVEDYIFSLPQMSQKEVVASIKEKFGADRAPSTSGLNRYFMKQRKVLENNDSITVKGAL